MKIAFLAEETDCGNQFVIIVALIGEEVPHGQLRYAVMLPTRQNQSEDVALQVTNLRKFADWIEKKTISLKSPSTI